MSRRFFYKVPGLVWLYHLLWAAWGIMLYGRPDKKIFLIGVTGTKGKTTTIEFLNSILEGAGKKTAILSSLRVKIDDLSEKNRVGNTMPGRLHTRKFLRTAVRAGCKYALIEVTSQGIVQSRHRFFDWNIGVLTNISPEHIEAHGSFEQYREAKLAFLAYVLKKDGTVFVNRDDSNYNYFVRMLGYEGVESYSKDDAALQAVLSQSLMSAQFGERKDVFDITSGFNKENVAAAAAVARKFGIGEKIIQEAVADFKGVPGRMEFVVRRPFSVVVDYAHTPDSLKKVYSFLKESGVRSQESRLICVLGAAGGGRDKWKRPVMGKIAAGLCDEVILTDEDPYDENPHDIIEEIAAGYAEIKPPSQLFKIVDRREAIAKALSLTREGDVVVITGKGSEDFIHVARGKKIPWNDRKVVEEVLHGTSR